MTFESFINTKNKWQKVYKEVSDKIQVTSNQDSNNTQIKNNVSRLDLDFGSFSKIRNYDTAWVDADSIMSGDTIYRLYKTWQINFPSLDVKYLSFFKCDILAKLNTSDTEGIISGNSNFYVPYSTYFSKSFVWDIKDLESNSSSDNKNATLNASIYITKPIYLTLPLFKFKLLIKFLPLRHWD